MSNESDNESLAWDSYSDLDESFSTHSCSYSNNDLDTLCNQNYWEIVAELEPESEANLRGPNLDTFEGFTSPETSPDKIDIVKRANSVECLVSKYEKKLRSPLQPTRSNSRPLSEKEIKSKYRMAPKDDPTKGSASARAASDAVSDEQAQAQINRAGLTQEAVLENLEATQESYDLLATQYIDVLNPIIANVARTTADNSVLKSKYNMLKNLLTTVNSNRLDVERLSRNFDKHSTNYQSYRNLFVKYLELGAKIEVTLSEAKNIVDALLKDTIIVDAERMTIPDYDGEFAVYKKFKTSFTRITGGMGTENKKQRLIKALKGKARERVEDLILADRDYDTLWKTLDDFYGNKKHCTDVLIGGLFNLSSPYDNLESVRDHYFEFRNKSMNVLELGLNAEELLAAYYLVQLPGEVRAKVETE